MISNHHVSPEHGLDLVELLHDKETQLSGYCIWGVSVTIA